jgi:hypothetical protein
MTKAIERLVIVILAMFLSFGIWFGSVITAHIFRETYAGSVQPPEFFMPMPTRLAVHWYWVSIVFVCLFASAGLVLSAVRIPESVAAGIGIGMPLLTGWFALFAFTFEWFLGEVSMHHPQWFEPGSFLFSFGGFFPISLMLIALLLGVCARDTIQQRRRMSREQKM